MHFKKLIPTALVLTFFTTLFGQLQSPDEFLPYNLGEQFTPHHMLVDYFQHVAENSPNVQFVEYGHTNEHRTLFLVIVSSEENLADLEAIRNNNLKIAGLVSGDPDFDAAKAIVWLSYSVHGNEAAGSESSMRVVFELASGANGSAEWLKNTVVIMDPSVNPDGYNRYSNWNNQVSGKLLNPRGVGREHNEPWPGGRVNHYYFDLNRDWVWQTQVESQQRIVQYNKWMPQVLADFHEMGAQSSYYFAPAAQPFHKFITDWQRQFQDEIGINHARYFDKEGWRYFTKETFDLFYPGYADTYSMYNGAIGMTYEQGGGGYAGRGVKTSNGDTLKLADRIAHHAITSLSTIEISSDNAESLITKFNEYFTKSENSPPGEYKSYVIKDNNPEGRMKALCALLDRLGIAYGHASASSVTGIAYGSREEASFDIGEDDLVISAFQPRAVLTQILFDPASILVDSLTYDITSWALPFAYGLKAYASSTKIDVSEGYEFEPMRTSVERDAYAYAMRWNSMENAAVLGQALVLGLKPRFANKPFTVEGVEYRAGTVLFMQQDHHHIPAFYDHISQLQADGAGFTSIHTGFVESGKDFGSGTYSLVEKPKVITIAGHGVSSNSLGQIWYTFEQTLDYPITIVNVDGLSWVKWTDYNTLILPEGYYSLKNMDDIKKWVKGGGKIIALGSAVSKFADKEGFALKKYAEKSGGEDDEKKIEQEKLDARLHPYAEGQRRNISNRIPGAVFEAKVDTTHPLGYGLGEYYYTLKTGTRSYEHLTGAVNAVYLEEELMYFGFVGSKAEEKIANSIVFAEERSGRGSIVYMVDNPLFRGFWENGKFAFCNALFLVGNK
jgi:zinc carboxypeptidase